MKKSIVLLLFILPLKNIAAQTADKITVIDTRLTDDPPLSFSREARFHFKKSDVVGLPSPASFSGLMTVAPWSDNSGNKHHQIGFNEGGLFWRTGLPASSWEPWMRIVTTNANGSVGIGTPASSYKLEVRSNDASNLRLVSNGSTPGIPSIDLFDILHGTEFVVSPSAGKVDLFTFSGHALALGTANTERMRILANGNVGIGTPTPSYKFEVKSSSASNLRLVSNGSTPGIPSIDLFDNIHGTEFVLSPSAGKVDLFTFSGHALALGTANTERMRILPNGDVGIGTDKPDARLTVAGDISSREVRVTVNAGSGPDYVFEKDYTLLPLSELETYIKQNKHLPEVPSAKEMEAEGLNLKEMNLLLLKKVEELTLHLIEINKINASQYEFNRKLLIEIENLKKKY
jgi:hypothetical protein